MILATVATLFAGYIAASVLLTRKRLGGLSGWTPIVSPMSLPGAVLPTSWFNPGLQWVWLWRKTAYFNRTHDIISMVPLLWGEPLVYIASVDVAKQILSSEGVLIKAPEMSAPLMLWGPNLVAANGDTWKRHRRIVGPSFSSQIYSLVWTETTSMYGEMLAAQDWASKDSVVFTNIGETMAKFAFTIIARCGFGLEMAWVQPAGGFGSELALVCQTTLTRLVVPKLAYKLPIQRLADIDRAWKAVAVYMKDLIKKRRDDLAQASHVDNGDIFTRLVDSLDASSKLALSEEEVIGNIFVMMFAGHETTADVLAATISFLAIHQDEQEKAFQELERVVPDGREATVHDMAELKHLTACFQEASRIYPPGYMLTRDTLEDLPLQVSNPSKATVVIPKGTRIIIDMIALHQDPQTFPEPHKFVPSRWYGVPEHEVTSFGAGPRGCIGRRFAHTEAVCLLALFIREWKFDIELQNGESRDEYEERVMGNAWFGGLSFSVGPVSVKMTRRT